MQLESLPKWMVRSTDDPGVALVSTASWIPFRGQQAQQRRTQLVSDLRQKLPFVLLWLERGESKDIPGMLGSPDITNDGAEFRLVPEGVLMDQLLPQLSHGSWGMFLFAKRPEQLPSPPVPLIPSRRPRTADLLGSTGAQAAILSYPDDVEWLVVGPVAT